MTLPVVSASLRIARHVPGNAEDRRRGGIDAIRRWYRGNTPWSGCGRAGSGPAILRQPVYDPHEVRPAIGLHLAHDLSAMGLDGDFAETEGGGDLLVQPPGGDHQHDLPLPRREDGGALHRSEERRVGKEYVSRGRARGAPSQ